MIQTLWFFIKIIVLAALLIWVANLTGEMSLGLLGYEITLPSGIFLLLLGLISLVAYLIVRVIRSVFLIPQKIVKYHEESQQQKGFSALTRGLVAVAAGDGKQASYYARRAQIMLPDNQMGLQLLLEAQAAKMRGEDGLAQNRFEALMNNKDAAFLGIRGLLKSAMDKDNYLVALEYAEQAAKLHPNQSWILQTLYHLQIKNKLWSDVLQTSAKALKAKVLDKDKLQSDQIAIYLMRYDYESKEGDASKALNYLKQAYKIAPEFTPAALRYGQYYLAHNKKRKASNIVKKAWQANPHPDLAILWDQMAPTKKTNQPKILQWYQQLVDACPDDAESHILYARTAIDLELWGEAKSSLVRAEKIKPSARIYRLMAIVEQNSTQNENSIHQLMEKASDAMPDKVWICAQSGIIYEEWTPIAAPHGSFNTVVWQYPGAGISRNDNFAGESNEGMLLIDPAA